MRRRSLFFLLVLLVALGGGLFAAGSWVAGMLESRVAALPGVSVASVRADLLGVELEGVRVRRKGHAANVASVSLRPALSTLVADGLVLARLSIESPVIELAAKGGAGPGSGAGSEAGPEDGTGAKPGDAARGTATARDAPRVKIKRLLLRNGVVQIPADAGHAPIRLEAVRLEVADIAWPSGDGRSPFSLQARIAGDERSRLALRGWVAAAGREARVTVSAQRLPLVRLSPWFRDVGTTAPVSDGELALDAAVVVQDEHYSASGTLTLGGVEFETLSGDFLGVSARVVERVFRVPENRVELPFEVSGSTAAEGNWRANLLRAAFRDAGARLLADGGAARALDKARERLEAGDVEGAVDTLREARDGEQAQ